MNIVVLISGNGSNLQAIIDACKTNKIKGTVRAVFSNKADAFGLLYFCVAPRGYCNAYAHHQRV